MKKVLQENFIFPRENQWKLRYARAVLDGKINKNHSPAEITYFLPDVRSK